jgi:hypothetical protein
MVDGGHLELVVEVKWSADRLEVGGASGEDIAEDAVSPAVGAVGREWVGQGELFTALGGVRSEVGNLGVAQ